MQSVYNWVRKQDEFGSYARFNYRGESGYGTGIGGCLSLIITSLVAFLTIVQLSGWVFNTQYNQNTTIVYNDAKGNPEDFQESVIHHDDSTPTFIIKTTFNNGTILYNDSTLFKYRFEQFNEKKNETNSVDAINCIEYVETYMTDETQEEKNNFIQQLSDEEHQLCPATNEYVLSSDDNDRKQFKFRIYFANETTSDLAFVKQTVV